MRKGLKLRVQTLAPRKVCEPWRSVTVSVPIGRYVEGEGLTGVYGRPAQEDLDHPRKFLVKLGVRLRKRFRLDPKAVRVRCLPVIKGCYTLYLGVYRGTGTAADVRKFKAVRLAAATVDMLPGAVRDVGSTDEPTGGSQPTSEAERKMLDDCGITKKGRSMALDVYRWLSRHFEGQTEKVAWDRADLVAAVARQLAAERTGKK